MLLNLTRDSLLEPSVESDASIVLQESVVPALSEAQVAALLRANESPYLEFKRVSGKMVSKALETICAFANSNGGTLILGIADASQGTGPSRIHGVEENPEAVDELRRKIETQFNPPGVSVHCRQISVVKPCGARVHLLMLEVSRSEHVHTIVGDGTWIRLGASNCQMTASQIFELAYKRGDRTAETECMAVNCDRLDTPAWRTYAKARGLVTGDIKDQLLHIDMARIDSTERHEQTVRPLRAAVLLFAENPGDPFAVAGAGCEIKMLVYSGTRVEASPIPNLRKSPRVFRGPLIQLIEDSVRAIGEELEEGLTMVGSGFRARHRLPMRVVREAIVNAVVHRDYRLNRDIFVRVFDNRIEVESPGGLPGAITTENIRQRGSKPRNRLIARALFDFPERPNIHAGEGVRMMFSEMERAGLYPPQYLESSLAAGDCVTVMLMSVPKHELWDAVSYWIDENGSICNSAVCALGKLSTDKASRLLKKWADLGLLQRAEGRGRKNRVYLKTGATRPGLRGRSGERAPASGGTPFEPPVH